MNRHSLRGALALSALVCAACGGGAEAVDATIATVQPIRSGVQIGDQAALPVLRIGPGQTVSAAESGLARLDLDGGATLLLGASSRVVVHGPEEVELAEGRLFAQVDEGDARLRVRTPRGAVGTSDGSLSARVAGAQVAVYVVRGEVGFGGAGQHGVARSGEQVLLGEGAPEVSPVAVWRDWTGGLARPGPEGATGPAGVGSLEARLPGETGRARSPLVVRRLEVRVSVQGDLAITEVDQVFWNPTDGTVEGLYRMRTPEGAVLQRFAIDRNGQLADAYVRERQQARAAYDAQVYAGSRDDPALLEWDAPGSFRARIYPIGPRETRRIVVRYAEWLTRPAVGAPRLYRYPMASAGRPPHVEDFSLEVDLGDAEPGAIRAGMGATVEDTTVVLRRTDFRPRADFWLEIGDDDAPEELRAYRAGHTPPRRAPNAPAPEGEGEEPDYFFLPLVLPIDLSDQAAPAGVDVVIVADVSAATDPSHLELGQSMVEAIAEHLGPQDRIAVVASDQSVRPVAAGEGLSGLGPAAPARVEQLLGGLARVDGGGATDLGSAITAAGDLLDPSRRGAVVYVGDGAPTVGELQAEDLLERMARLPDTARLFGVAVGSNANLDLLATVVEGRGLSMRIEERRAAAESALRILSHMSRPMARRITVHLGDGIESVFPAGEAEVVLGDVLPIVGRVRGRDLPETVRVTGRVAGRDFDEQVAVETVRVDDGGDLRSRWAGERLLHLLAEGVPRETIVDLGTRYGLITPYTSFYAPSARELRQMGHAALLEPLETRTPTDRATGRVALALRAAIAGPLAMAGCRDAAESLVASSAPAREAPMVAPSLQAPEMEQSPAVATPSPAPSMEEAVARSDSADRAASAAPPSPPAPSSASAPMGGAPPQPVVAAPSAEGMAQDRVLSTGSGRVASGGGMGDMAHLGQLRVGRAGGGSTKSASRPSRRREAARDHRRRNQASEADDEVAATTAEPEEPVEVAADGDAEVRLDGSGSSPGLAEESTETTDRAAAHRARECSSAADLPLGDRRSLWRERLQSAPAPQGWARVYRRAVRDCEAPSWRDRRALLDLVVVRAGTVERLIQTHRAFGRSGAAPYLQRAILRRVRTPADLVPIRRAFGGGGPGVDWPAVDALLAAAGSPEARVELLRRLVAEHQGSFELQLRLLAALEAAGRVPEAMRLVDQLRDNRLSDPEVRTALGEVVLRQGDEQEARRVFAEMVEFAPYDALARRRLGDLCRAHGWWTDAYRQYQTLAEIQPDDPSVHLLLAAAAAGAGRVDEALRLEQRIAESPEPGASGGLARAAILWSSVRLARLRAAARERSDSDQLASLLARMRRSGVLREAGALRITLVWSHPHAGVALWASHPGGSLTRPRDLWPELGIEAFDLEDSEDGAYRIEVRRSAEDQLTAVEAQLVVVWNEGQSDEHIAIVPLRFDREHRSFAWTLSGRELDEAQPLVAAAGEVL